jgi:hypothetical protein
MMLDIGGSMGMMHGMGGAGNAGAFNSFQQGMNYARGMGKSARSSLSYFSYVTKPQM